MIGIEIGVGRVRAVVRGRRGASQTFDVPWTTDALDTAVSELQARVGDAASIALSFGLGHLHVKQVKLPPVTHAARRQMLMVEPDRWFANANSDSTAIALDADGGLALAADGDFVEACVTAFSRWAPVLRVEAAPMSVARAFRWAGVNGAYAVLDASPGEVGIVQVDDGALRMVRRVRLSDNAPSMHGATEVPGVETPFVTAFGATLPADTVTGTQLLTVALEHGFASVRQRRTAAWSVAALAAVCTAVWSLGVSRERTLDAIGSAVADARAAAAPGQAAVARTLLIDREMAAISTTVSSRVDALAALASIGARLPDEAVAQRVRMAGNEWQVEGNAATASAVLAALAAEPRFERVRFLAPSNRFRDGTEDRETFAIAFAVR
jgi:hypothetical protein